jgi:hypothetical protein
MKNIMEKVEEAREIVNIRYTLSLREAFDIVENSRNEIDILSNGFNYGYMQGYKAAKTEMKKVRKEAANA